jgi:uncharacterized protein
VDLPAPDRPPSGRSLVVLSVVFYGVVAAAALLWGLLDGGRTLFFHPGRGPSGRMLWNLAAGLGIAASVIGLGRLAEGRLRWVDGLQDALRSVLPGLTTRQAAILALVSAVGEEALFRGALLPTLGLLPSAALFGMAHVPTRRALWPWPIFAFALGLLFGWLYQGLGDLGGPILAHGLVNLVNLRHLAQSPPGPEPGPVPDAPPGGEDEAGTDEGEA